MCLISSPDIVSLLTVFPFLALVFLLHVLFVRIYLRVVIIEVVKIDKFITLRRELVVGIPFLLLVVPSHDRHPRRERQGRNPQRYGGVRAHRNAEAAIALCEPVEKRHEHVRATWRSSTTS